MLLLTCQLAPNPDTAFASIILQGYSSYIKLFYTIAAAGGVTVAGSMYAAAVYKEGESNSAWLKR